MAILSQNYSLDKCVIVTSLGQPIDFTNLFQEFNYYEDIFGAFVSGDITINDSLGLLSQMGFNGHEYLMLEFSQPNLAECQSLSRSFRIYKVSNRQLTRDQNETYTLHFCSEETVLSEQYRISKSYKSKLVSDMVTDIMANYLKKPVILNIEPTKGLRDIIIPNMKPLEALNWLTTQAISASNAGADYLFYENYNGYNFSTLQSLYNNEVPARLKFKYQPKNIQQVDENNPAENMINVYSFEVINNFDSLFGNNSGMLANRLISVDIIRQKYTNTVFDYAKYFSSAKKLNPNPVLSNFQNRFGDTDNATANATLKVVTTNTGQTTYSPYIKSRQPDIRDINIEKIVPHRTAQIPLSTYIRYKIAVPGNPQLTVGQVIEFYLPEISRRPGGKDEDRFYSGKYLVTAVRHKIDFENRFVTVMEISKESLPSAYDSIDNSSPAWKNQVAQ